MISSVLQFLSFSIFTAIASTMMIHFFLVSQIKKDFKEIIENIDNNKQFGNKNYTDDIYEIRSTVEKINSDLKTSVDRIVAEVKNQQNNLSATVQQKFEEQSQISVHIIKESMQKELSKFIPIERERDILLDSFIEVIEPAILRMGDFQRINLQQQSEKAITNINQKVTSSITEVVRDVDHLQNQVAMLPITASNKVQRRSPIKKKL
jgi:hypothetical protein